MCIYIYIYISQLSTYVDICFYIFFTGTCGIAPTCIYIMIIIITRIIVIKNNNNINNSISNDSMHVCIHMHSGMFALVMYNYTNSCIIQWLGKHDSTQWYSNVITYPIPINSPNIVFFKIKRNWYSDGFNLFEAVSINPSKFLMSICVFFFGGLLPNWAVFKIPLSLSLILVVFFFFGIPLLDYYSPQYIKGSTV